MRTLGEVPSFWLEFELSSESWLPLKLDKLDFILEFLPLTGEFDVLLENPGMTNDFFRTNLLAFGEDEFLEEFLSAKKSCH